MRMTAETIGSWLGALMLGGTLLLVPAGAGPAGAQPDAGTITFTLDHDVWIMAADNPSGAMAVTTDGTAESPYLSPTQDDQGRIIAIAGGEGGDIVRMDQDGTLLGDAFRPPGARNLVDLDVRGDGEVVAYTHYGSHDAGNGQFVVAPAVGFAYADGRDPGAIASPAFDEAYLSYSPSMPHGPTAGAVAPSP